MSYFKKTNSLELSSCNKSALSKASSWPFKTLVFRPQQVKLFPAEHYSLLIAAEQIATKTEQLQVVEQLATLAFQANTASPNLGIFQASDFNFSEFS